MPELIEVETYRRQAERTTGRCISEIEVIDDLGLRGQAPDEVRSLLAGATVVGAERIGKLLLIATDGPVLGLRFGMTGRLLIDGGAEIEHLEYGGTGDEPRWDRFVARFTDGGDLRVRDPRRLGGIELDPDTSVLGPDAASIGVDGLAGALAGSRTALKARLLDQRRVAGLGNLLVDEVLWRAGIDPERPCDRLGPGEVQGLATTVRSTIAELSRRGGSHTGDLQAARRSGGRCPVDGAPLDRLKVGGRTTYRCPSHQR